MGQEGFPPMDVKVNQYRVESGNWQSLGATPDADGTNFSLFSAHAERVELCLFDDSGTIETARIELPEFTNEIWHGLCTRPETRCTLRLSRAWPVRSRKRPSIQPQQAARRSLCPRTRRRRSNGPPAHFGYNRRQRGQGPVLQRSRTARAVMPKCRGDRPDMRMTGDTTAVRTYSVVQHDILRDPRQGLHPVAPRHPAGPARHLRGHGPRRRSSDYIKSLGITSVELMPIHEFPDDDFLLKKGLRNFWGYNTLGFFAPAQRYYGPRGMAGFRDMVRAFHDAGIEVILDVVYNHTAEGNEMGPTLSFKGIDNLSYYRTLPDNHRYYINDTGTGNTVNTSHPRVLADGHGFSALLGRAHAHRRLPLRPRHDPRARAGGLSTSAAASSTRSARIRCCRRSS